MAREKFLTDTFILVADRIQNGGMITQLSNDYTKGQQTYQAMVQKVQYLLTASEGEK